MNTRTFVIATLVATTPAVAFAQATSPEASSPAAPSPAEAAGGAKPAEPPPAEPPEAAKPAATIGLSAEVGASASVTGPQSDANAEAKAAAAPAAPADAAQAAEPAAPAKKPPYSLPWALRPVNPVNVVRSDTSLAFAKPSTGQSATTVASTILASYKVTKDFAPILKLGVVDHSPEDQQGGTGFLNPIVGGLYGVKLPDPFRLGVFLGLSVPVGAGGGKSPDPDTAAAMRAGAPARAAMDNAMFAQNYFTVFPGVDFAIVASGFTAQVELTILRLTKVRGPDGADDGNTNLTGGLHVGYFLIPELSIGGELRHQRWLSNPAVVRADHSRAARDNTTLALGPRLHLKVGDSAWLRPGISYSFAVDDPLSKQKYRIVQLDVPFVF